MVAGPKALKSELILNTIAWEIWADNKRNKDEHSGSRK
jgi:hypothetical protein